MRAYKECEGMMRKEDYQFSLPFFLDSSFIFDRRPINFQHHIIYFVDPVYVKKITAAGCVYCFCSFNFSVYIYRWNKIMCCALMKRKKWTTKEDFENFLL